MTRTRRARAPTRTTPPAWVRSVLVAACLATGTAFLPCAAAVADPSFGPQLAARLPVPAVVAQGVSSANAAHLFRDPVWDFARMRQVFNTVALLPGDQDMVDEAGRAGLAVVLEFDFKADFFAGRDIGPKVAAVADQIASHPGSVAAVHVADRLDERYSAQQGLRYLAATGGVLHRLVPGVPVLVNASDWQLTCGLPGQSSCGSHGDLYQYETDATLDAFAASGYLDGMSVADNLKNQDAAAQATAWERARARWPRPFLLWATCSQLSFGAATYRDRPAADAATRAYMRAPVAHGADAVALWAWHQKYQQEVDTFLDKDGGSNAMWAAMSAAAADIGSGSGVGDLPPAARARQAPPWGRLVLVLVALVAVLVLAVAVSRIRGPSPRPTAPHRPTARS